MDVTLGSAIVARLGNARSERQMFLSKRAAPELSVGERLLSVARPVELARPIPPHRIELTPSLVRLVPLTKSAILPEQEKTALEDVSIIPELRSEIHNDGS